MHESVELPLAEPRASSSPAPVRAVQRRRRRWPKRAWLNGVAWEFAKLSGFIVIVVSSSTCVLVLKTLRSTSRSVRLTDLTRCMYIAKEKDPPPVICECAGGYVFFSRKGEGGDKQNGSASVRESMYIMNDAGSKGFLGRQSDCVLEVADCLFITSAASKHFPNPPCIV